MLNEELINNLKKKNCNVDNFNHFDYLQAVDMIEQMKNKYPKRYKIVSQFQKKVREKLQKDNQQYKRQHYQNFISRSTMFQKQHQQKMQAMRFIYQKYDIKNDQLLFYPRTTVRKATKKGYCWKDPDQTIESQQTIQIPNNSIFQYY